MPPLAGPRWTLQLLALLLLGGLIHAQSLLAESPLPDRVALKMSPAQTTLSNRLSATESAQAEYIGTAACLECHSGRLAGAEQAHPALLEFGEEGDWHGHSCEVCHGPGSVHIVGGGNVEGIVQPLKIPVAEANAICLTCHEGTSFGTRSMWHNSPHNQASVACVTCHDPHRETPSELRPLDSGGLLGVDSDALPVIAALVLGPPYAGPESALATDWHFSDSSRAFSTEERFCLSCHTDTSLDFKLRSHHPLEENQMSCSSCHDPHAKEVKGEDLIRKTNGLCESCHGDYAGPFLFDHPVVHDVSMGDGCLTCHNAHGSSHDHLLKIDNRGLCLQCHTDKDDVGVFGHYSGTCWASGCHSQVHGSQTDYNYIDPDEPSLEVLH
ncbi:MAG: cytochrome c3 family protein [bacterium]